MNIGGISNMNYAAAMRMNTPSSVMRLNSPAAEYATRSAVGQPVLNASPAAPVVVPFHQGPSVMYFNPDGDSLEISLHSSLSALNPLEPQEPCQTCENRRYVDQSNDASVSFQTPTKISPNMAGMAVAAHEQEHVRNEQANALQNDREIVNQSVTIHYDTCSECGKIYVSGGTTKTTSIGKSDSEDKFEPEELSTGGETPDED